MTKLKVLLLAANPSGTTKLALDEEARSIAEKVRLAEYRDSIEVIAALAARADDLLQLLNVHKPHIVHFSGHGGTGGIFLVGENGHPHLVSTAALTALFHTLTDNIRVVLLNSCHSEAQATAITDCIDVCIGMGTSVNDKTAITFAASFYRALAFGRSIDDAFNQGRVAIMLAGLMEPDAPKLVTKVGVIPRHIVLVPDPLASDLHAAGTSSLQLPGTPSLTQQPRPASERPTDDKPGVNAAAAPVLSTPDDVVQYEPVPEAAVRLYRLFWQLEAWLRILVYVELRAARPDWDEMVKPHVRDWSPKFRWNDSRSPCVGASAPAALFSLSFDELSQIILDIKNWPLFEPYFPPRRTTDVRLEEIGAVRTRVVQFHEPEPDDEPRLNLFLQEMDRGLQRFCARYTIGKAPCGPADDPVTEHLFANWHRFGYGVELQRPDLTWMYAPPPHRERPLFGARLQLLTHDKYTPGSMAGIIYRLTCHPMRDNINFEDLLQSTRALHDDVLHIVAPLADDDVIVTVPAISGVEHTGEILGAFLSAARNCSEPRTAHRITRNLSWPRHLVLPNDILAFFVAGYPGSAFVYQ